MLRLLPLFLVIVFGYFGYAMMVPIFSSVLIDNAYPLFPPGLQLGERTFLLGLLLMMYPLGQFLGSPVIGSMGDKYGRKPVLLFTLTIVALCLFGVSLCMTYHLYHLIYLLVFITGFFESNIATAQAAIADISSEEEKPFRLGVTLACASAGFVLGPLFGGHLANLFTYATPFWVITVILFGFILWIFFFFEETHPEDARVHVHFFQALTNIRHVFVETNLRPVYACAFFGGVVFFGFLRLFPGFMMTQFGLDLAQVSTLLSVTNLPMFITLFLAIKPLVAKFGPKRVGIFLFLILAALMIAFILTKSLSGSIALTFVITLVLPGGGVLYSVLISNRAGAMQGRALGNLTSVLVGAQTCAILTFNSLSGISYLLPYSLIFLSCLITSALFARLQNPKSLEPISKNHLP